MSKKELRSLSVFDSLLGYCLFALNGLSRRTNPTDEPLKIFVESALRITYSSDSESGGINWSGSEGTKSRPKKVLSAILAPTYEPTTTITNVTTTPITNSTIICEDWIGPGKSIGSPVHSHPDRSGYCSDSTGAPGTLSRAHRIRLQLSQEGFDFTEVWPS